MPDKPEIDTKRARHRQPPQHTRFKKGQSGNPGGRPKNKRTNFHDKVVETLDCKVPNGDNTVLDVVLNGVIRSAARGDVKAAKIVFDLYQDASRKQGQVKDQDEADAEAGKRFLKLDHRLFAELIEDKSTPNDSTIDDRDDRAK